MGGHQKCNGVFYTKTISNSQLFTVLVTASDFTLLSRIFLFPWFRGRIIAFALLNTVSFSEMWNPAQWCRLLPYQLLYTTSISTGCDSSFVV